jgi:kinesin family protein 2/24
VRKRPLFAHETARGEFDTVTVPICGGADVAVHACLMYPDLRRMFVRHLRYSGAVAFGAAASDDDVYAAAAGPLVAAAQAGAPAALFMYGQTGSGKTHTMGALEARAASALLPALAEGVLPPSVTLSYFEIAGKHATDLLRDAAFEGDAREVTLRELPPPRGAAPDAPGRMELIGASEVVATSATQLLETLAAGRARRAVSCTFANAASSRSHAVLRITLPASSGGGSLTLVDCAGSERKEDSDKHSAAQRKEGAEINASLYALKECIRARGRQSAQATSASAQTGHVHVPYRSSLLTRVLAECLTRADARLAVVGTLSPAAADTEHSLTTLQTVALLAGGGASEKEGTNGPGWSETKEDVSATLEVGADGTVRDVPPPRLVPPAMWRPAELRSWLRSVRNGAFAAAADAAPEWLAGRDFARMMPAALAGMLCGGDDAAGGALYDAFRDAVAKAAAAKAGAK